MHHKFIFALLVIGIGAVLVYSGYRSLEHASAPQTSCTAEALLCPDGSYVGRSGTECKFIACPNQPSFTGKLQQNGGNFSLILASPATSTQEVAYSMPLIIKITNVLANIVGQRVRVYGNFTEGATLNVDHLDVLSGKDADPTIGNATVGQTVFINGVNITLNRIVEDSRCPLGVQCIRAGAIVVNADLKSDTDKDNKNISSATAVLFDSFTVSVKDAEKSPAGAYTVTFQVKDIPSLNPRNQTYTVEGRNVILANGYAEEKQSGSSSSLITRYFGNDAMGDLNQDGLPDVAFILTQTTGGSGTFYYVAVDLSGPNGYKGTNAILLGDRISPQSTTIAHSQITVNYADKAPGAPMTSQNTVGVSKYFLIRGGVLQPAVQ